MLNAHQLIAYITVLYDCIDLGSEVFNKIRLYILIYFGGNWITFLLENDKNGHTSHFVEKL